MNRWLILQILFALALLVDVRANMPPQNPVIGILTVANEDSSFGPSSYIAASYVKFVEMSGAQVVPLYGFSSTSEITSLLGKINGVLFTGGLMDLDIKNQWTKNADAILKYAKEQNDKGNTFPIWATCLGFQLLAYLTSNYDPNLLTRVHGDDAVVLPVNITSTNPYIYSAFTSYQREKFTKGSGLMYFHHNWAILVDTFNKNKYLKDFWTLAATATTSYNEKFVTTMEAKKYPFYAVQFHAEKNLYEWNVYADRSLEGA